MNNPGVFTLAARQLTVALSAEQQLAIVDLDGMTACTLIAELAYGSGGTSCSAVVQTTFDGGTTWIDIARFDFLVASRKAICNLEGLLGKAVATYTALAAEGVLDGVLGNQLRAVITSVGTYANTTLSVRAAVR